MLLEVLRIIIEQNRRILGWNKTNTFKLLLVSYFHIHQAHTIILTKYSDCIDTIKFKLLSHFSILLLTALVYIAFKQLKYDTSLNIIIWRFSRRICFDGDGWK